MARKKVAQEPVRQTVTVPVTDCYVDISDVLDGQRPAEVIEVMQHYLERFKGRDVYFSVEHYGYDGGVNLKLYECRLENDREFEQRLASEKRQQAAAEKAAEKTIERERKEYLRLKKKFEKLEGK